ncbi:hypothetical protein L1987_18593 [Smallanthus sonchifolius]|uniref:Uncharacterized protein n=1 Tax=Smallanthus sonchifolius TaxID=185202 RepID=A0ACB9J2D1_9ASTR|nr:hypothetical protein L1987_18593 [Smallanthus sonchifolius]
MWDELNKDEQVKSMLKKVKHRLAIYFPVFIDEASRISVVLEEVKTVIDVMLILCCEFMDSDEEFVVFDATSRRLLKCGFTQRQLELLSLAGRLPMKQNVDEKETVVGRHVDPDTYKFLRILDIESIFIFSFPRDILNLVNLRYLAIKSEDGNPPTSISNLIHLQIFIISSTTNIVLPRTTWDIECLRHLYIKSGENLNLIEDFSSGKFIGILENLQTISGVCPSLSCLSILTRTPDLRKLSFSGPLVSTLGVLEFPNIHSLNCLQMLKLSNTMKYHAPFLKLQDLDIVKWEASSGKFPRLQRLVVRHCSRLQEIPRGTGEILTLELIEVSWCGESTAQSATRIQKEQERNGNYFLKVSTSVHRDLQGKRKRPSY